MNVINILSPTSQFTRLLERVARGERLVIGKEGKPIARLEPFFQTKTEKRFTGGNLRLQEKANKPLTPEYLNQLASSKYDD